MIQIKEQVRPKIEYYLSLNYEISLFPEATGGYTAEIKDLSGCLSFGETAHEALENIQDAKKLWLEDAYESKKEIPLPSHLNTYSGKSLLRMPKSLHKSLVEKAKGEGISLNQYLVYLISKNHQIKCDFDTLFKVLINRRSNSMSTSGLKITGVKNGTIIEVNHTENDQSYSNIEDGQEISLIVDAFNNENLIDIEEKRQKIDQISISQNQEQSLDQILFDIYQERNSDLA